MPWTFWVYDATTQNNVTPTPLVNVMCRFNNYGVQYTNTEGAAVFSAIPSGTWSGDISLSGYETQTFSNLITHEELSEGRTIWLVPLNPVYSDVTITVTPTEGGTTSPVAGHYMTAYLIGSDLTINVSPNAGYMFDHINRNGNTIVGNTISVLAQIETIEVIFTLSSNPQTTYVSITANPAGSGTITPSSDNYSIGTNLQLHPVPAVGFRYDHILRNGISQTSLTLVNLAAGGETVEVVFTETGGGGGFNWTWVLIGASVAVVGLGGYLFLRRKRKLKTT